MVEVANKQEKGFEESKAKASDEETKLDWKTFMQVLQGTLASSFELINYEKIITN